MSLGRRSRHVGQPGRWLTPPAPPSTPRGAGGWRDWWTVLHPPYTAWHLSYVVIGASLAPRVHISRLVATVLAFFLAVGVAAHCLDELHGRPLRTLIPGRALVAATVVSPGGRGRHRGRGRGHGWRGPGPVHRGRAAARHGLQRRALRRGRAHRRRLRGRMGRLPRAHRLRGPGRHAGAGRPCLAAAGAFALSWAQRSLSTPARLLRRSVRGVEGTLTLADGSMRRISTTGSCLAPLEAALRAMSWGLVTVAAGLAVARLT